MIYFDNSATGAYKPASVKKAVLAELRKPANPGRGGHPFSLRALSLCERVRETAGNLCGTPPERILFTKNCTESLNLAIFGLIPAASHVVTTIFDHNATLRPLRARERAGELTLSYALPESGRITLGSIRKCLKPDTSAVVLNCTSNVLGCTAELEEIAAFCKIKGLLLLLDGAQYFGHHRLDFTSLYFSALAVAPHKTLYAPQGIAFLAARELPKPRLFGGTGTASTDLDQPSDPPEGLESGTLNMPGIAGLASGLDYYRTHARSDDERLRYLTHSLYEGLAQIPGVSVYSAPNPAGIVSFLIDGSDSSETADLLARRGFAVRPGLHCAPLVHRFLGTLQSGLVRASLGPFNTEGEIRRFCKTVFQIASGS